MASVKLQELFFQLQATSVSIEFASNNEGVKRKVVEAEEVAKEKNKEVEVIQGDLRKTKEQLAKEQLAKEQLAKELKEKNNEIRKKERQLKLANIKLSASKSRKLGKSERTIRLKKREFLNFMREAYLRALGEGRQEEEEIVDNPPSPNTENRMIEAYEDVMMMMMTTEQDKNGDEEEDKEEVVQISDDDDEDGPQSRSSSTKSTSTISIYSSSDSEGKAQLPENAAMLDSAAPSTGEVEWEHGVSTPFSPSLVHQAGEWEQEQEVVVVVEGSTEHTPEVPPHLPSHPSTSSQVSGTPLYAHVGPEDLTGAHIPPPRKDVTSHSRPQEGVVRESAP
ncbi:unnamed protein product [Cyprideis torosa]|uniref:Uncharacterized protein n=1 Tax=Cyprideis torosa TaxID=163714 RepID=A0A7R8WIP4_9CRUS|nr:unnamed protein product [Cyprideis torosa]CAG0894715.1 unnamed protein product [Cyprideis torosa]